MQPLERNRIDLRVAHIVIVISTYCFSWSLHGTTPTDLIFTLSLQINSRDCRVTNIRIKKFHSVENCIYVVLKGQSSDRYFHIVNSLRLIHSTPTLTGTFAKHQDCHIFSRRESPKFGVSHSYTPIKTQSLYFCCNSLPTHNLMSSSTNIPWFCCYDILLFCI